MGQHLVAAGYLIAVAGELVQRVVLDRLEVRAQGVLPRGVAFLGQLPPQLSRGDAMRLTSKSRISSSRAASGRVALAHS
jgi:hypothetical protein